MQVYERVRNYLDSHGIKQVTLAKKVGISKQTFNAIMNGHRTLYADELRDICIALNVPPEIFICFNPEEPKKGKSQKYGKALF